MIDSARETSTIDEIVATLVSRFRPKLIYIFGSRARGDAKPYSDYDFLIEVDSLPEGTVLTRQSMMWLDDFEDIEVQVHVRKTGALERRKNDPWRVDWDVVREGVLLYSLDRVPPVVPGATLRLVREVSPQPASVVEEWIRVAEQDLSLSMLLSAEVSRWKEPICFHSQQSGEKFLKALIVSRRKKQPATHNLRALLHVARLIGFELEGIDGDCNTLTQYAVTARYPDDQESGFPTQQMSMADATEALLAAQRIAAAVRPLLS